MLNIIRIGDELFNLDNVFNIHMDEDDQGYFIGIYMAGCLDPRIAVRFDSEYKQVEAFKQVGEDINQLIKMNQQLAVTTSTRDIKYGSFARA